MQQKLARIRSRLHKRMLTRRDEARQCEYYASHPCYNAELPVKEPERQGIYEQYYGCT